MATAEFLDTALAIGRRLARQALWEGKVCTWEVLVSQPDPESRGRTARADGQLYAGTAGIAWFLGELYRATGEVEVGRAARGGLEHALAQACELSDVSLPRGPSQGTPFGFHSGRLGIAWVAVRFAELFEQPAYAESARRLLRPLVGQESYDQGLDVIAGAGGAIPACLDLAEKTGWDELRTIARKLGEHLIDQAHRTPEGWSWATGGESAVRNLTGFAHGTSGMGLALLELDRATGESRFRFAAEMAFLYERRLFDEARSNWPDLRHQEIGEYFFFQRIDELRRAVAERTLPPYEPKYMTAWCHGSPGIGLARLRAWELTGQDVYRQEARAALRSTLEAVGDNLSEGGNYSLCHGIGGNCELLLLAAELLREPELRQVAERAAAEGVEAYEARGRPWPCGTVGGVSDPSLLVGEAGIGAFYLRLADPQTPSLLLLRPRIVKAAATEPAGFEELARESVDDFFDTTLRVWTRLAPPGPALPSWQPDAVPLGRTPVEEAHEAIVTRLGEEADGRQQMLQDAFGPERTRYELTLELRDHTRAVLRRLLRPAWEGIDVQRAVFTLAPGVRLLSTRHDWQAWIEAPYEEEPPPESRVAYLCHQEGNSIRCQRVGPMVALLLEMVTEAASWDQVVDEVASAAGIQPNERLAAKIRAQLRETYLADFVDLG